MDKKGFTLIEILVVLGVTAVLSGLAIVYTHVGQDQIALSVEESKIAQLILEAKELSIATYSANANTCAYGVQFDYSAQTYSLFAYDSATTGGGRPICPSVASTTVVNQDFVDEYAGGSWNVHVSQGVKLLDNNNGNTLQDVLFYPPDPFTLISTDGRNFLYPAPEAYVYLSTVGNTDSRTISVDGAGQVNL